MLQLSLSVALAVGAMMLCRAVHPPAGAVAMTVALHPETVQELGFWFALAPVALGTSFLVLLAIPFAHLTGRRYPFRQFAEPNRHATADPEPVERLGLSEAELSDILGRYRQSFNLGPEDLARLIGAAELKAADRATGSVLAEQIMSRDLITVAPTTPLDEIISLFRKHRFTSLPVVEADGSYLGTILQIHVLEHAGALLQIPAMPVSPALAASEAPQITAHQVMSTSLPLAGPTTPIAALLHLVAESDIDAVPVLEGAKITGIVTRTDLVAALARSVARSQTQGSS